MIKINALISWFEVSCQISRASITKTNHGHNVPQKTKYTWEVYAELYFSGYLHTLKIKACRKINNRLGHHYVTIAVISILIRGHFDQPIVTGRSVKGKLLLWNISEKFVSGRQHIQTNKTRVPNHLSIVQGSLWWWYRLSFQKWALKSQVLSFCLIT